MLRALHLLRLGIVAVLALLLSLGAFMAFKVWPIGADVPLLRTPEWAGKYVHELNSGRLMIRRETVEGALLLKRVDLETVYRYDRQARSLTAATDNEWLNAGGPISACSGPGSTPPRAPVRLDGPNYKVFVGDHEVSTAGRLSLDYLISPTGRWVAILSAAGPVIPPMFFNSERILGQRYHQLVSVPDAVSVGSSTRIPVPDTVSTLRPCWSADEQLVVYTDSNFSSLIVVETALTPPNR